LKNHLVNTKRWIIRKIAESFWGDNFRQGIKRLPFERIPPGSEAKYRCCVYKERAVVRSRVLAGLGFSVEADDEMTSLLEYADAALKRKRIEGPPLTIIDIACKGCVNSRYYVTELCQGCLARPCETICPFGAVTVKDGHSTIDVKKCRNCGKCKEACPYHAISKISVPCEENCPVDAITKGEHGVASIDFTKCISCGCCVAACPFGAVLERSQVVDILRALKSERKVAAITAPALVGQFEASLRKLSTAMKKLGFSEVVEVASGAERTAREEAEELMERLSENGSFMTTSCCPAYIQTVRRHMPEMLPHISDTPTPMHYTGEMVKSKDPQVLTVFIGPCVAKRREAMEDSCVDHIMTFEELASVFEAAGIDPASCEDDTDLPEVSAEGRGFALSGGVAAAVKSFIGSENEIRTACINGTSKSEIARMRAYAKNGGPFDLLEVMTCAGGCVNGAGVINKEPKARDDIRKLVSESKSIRTV
jgi:[FeFe] hydrogenase (group B1/B3)